MISKFYFRPAKGEHIETAVPLEAEEFAAIYGRVLDARGKPVPETLVLLFDAAGDVPGLQGRALTDADGHFAFGPLEGERLYLIKLFKNDIKLRELEIHMD